MVEKKGCKSPNSIQKEWHGYNLHELRSKCRFSEKWTPKIASTTDANDLTGSLYDSHMNYHLGQLKEFSSLAPLVKLQKNAKKFWSMSLLTTTFWHFCNFLKAIAS